MGKGSVGYMIGTSGPREREMEEQTYVQKVLGTRRSAGHAEREQQTAWSERPIHVRQYSAYYDTRHGWRVLLPDLDFSSGHG